MGLILDTSVLIAAEKGAFALGNFFSAHEEEPFFIAAVTAAELLHGVERADSAARRKKRSAFVEAVLEDFETIEYDLSVARRHAVLWAALEKKGRRIGPYDLQIAATALQRGFALVTLNRAEFSQVPGLKLIATEPFAQSP